MSATVKALVNYNDEYRAMLYRVPKCANTSLRVLFPQEAHNNRRQGSKWLKNTMSDKYDSYYKLAFVRNPYDRLVSCWKACRIPWQLQFRNFEPAAAERDLLYRKLKLKKEQEDEALDVTLSEFVRMIEEGCIDVNNRHVTPQAYLVPTDIDFIGRFETLQEDFDIVCDKIGMPKQTLPHKNKCTHEHYTEYYDDKTREIVTRMYEQDLEAFGYKFGE